SDSLDLNLNDDAARLTFARAIYDEKLEIDAGWLHHQDRGDLLSLSLGRIGEAGGGQQSVTAAIGGRLYAMDPEFAPGGMGASLNQDGFALGIGGFFRLKLAGYDRIGFSAHGYYAPDVLAFGDSNDLIEVAGRVTYSVIREADLYLGVRYIKAGFDGIDAKFDNGLHVGIRLEF
ncbi:MAG: YfaZ family protein, partial [Gammaproteobacteria bacterium]|nr:YfaZ family protein [Gammaproteobacteria bacterium]